MRSPSKGINHKGNEVPLRELEDPANGRMQVPRTRNDRITRNINICIFRMFKELKKIRNTTGQVQNCIEVGIFENSQQTF